MEDSTHIVVIDNWGPPELLRAVDATWPTLNWEYWHKYADSHAVKYGTKDPDRLPAAAKQIVSLLAEIDLRKHGFSVDVFPDMNLHGAGLHCIPPTGFLGRHLDGACHPLKPWKREINAVLFVSPWDSAWGGNLYFDDCTLEPKFNRLILFSTTENSYHGVDPVTGPKERRTVSLFWWSHNETRNRECAEFT